MSIGTEWKRPIRAMAALTSAILLAGCATFSADGGFSPVETAARERLGQDTRWIRSQDDKDSARQRVRELLTRPLSADDAVQIALLNNPGLQATYAQLGVAEAELVQASRLTNPIFSYAHVKGGGELKSSVSCSSTSSTWSRSRCARAWANGDSNKPSFRFPGRC